MGGQGAPARRILRSVTAAINQRDWSLLSDLLVAGFTYLPATTLVVGLAVALFGNAPKAMPLTWLVLAHATVVGLLGETLALPTWIRNLSPFDHVPRLPGQDPDVQPIVALAVAAAVLIAAGIAGFRRRDVAAT